MKIDEYYSDDAQNWIEITAERSKWEPYQIEVLMQEKDLTPPATMLSERTIKYAVTGLTSLRHLPLTAEIIERIPAAFQSLMERSKNHLLDQNRWLLKPEYLYWDEEKSMLLGLYAPTKRSENTIDDDALSNLMMSLLISAARNHLDDQTILGAYHAMLSPNPDNHLPRQVIESVGEPCSEVREDAMRSAQEAKQARLSLWDEMKRDNEQDAFRESGAEGSGIRRWFSRAKKLKNETAF